MREKLCLFLLGVCLGIMLGYWYRMAQVEPSYEKELVAIQQTQKRICKDLYNLELRLICIEESKKK